MADQDTVGAYWAAAEAQLEERLNVLVSTDPQVKRFSFIFRLAEVLLDACYDFGELIVVVEVLAGFQRTGIRPTDEIVRGALARFLRAHWMLRSALMRLDPAKPSVWPDLHLPKPWPKGGPVTFFNAGGNSAVQVAVEFAKEIHYQSLFGAPRSHLPPSEWVESVKDLHIEDTQVVQWCIRAARAVAENGFVGVRSQLFPREFYAIRAALEGEYGEAVTPSSRSEKVVLWEGAEPSPRNIRLARARSAYLECHGDVQAAMELLEREGHPIRRSTFYDYLNELDALIPGWRNNVLSESVGNPDKLRIVRKRRKRRGNSR